MSAREPIADEFDAVVDLYPTRGVPKLAYGLVKRTYELVESRCLPAPAQALYHDIRKAETTRKLAPGSDFWVMKMFTDVAVRGHAWAPGGSPVRSRMIGIRVARTQKSIAVFGHRSVDWPARGSIEFSSPQPFERVPLVWANAYGGADLRVPVEDPPTIATLSRLQVDHPGLYPRNPFGRGYVVVDEPSVGITLPNLEDPDQLLRPETLITGDPRRWYHQPLPVCTEFTNALMFPRFCWLGLEAWYPPEPEAPLREVALGRLPSNFHELGRLQPGDTLPSLALQEGPMGLTFAPLAAGTPILVEGMSPDLDQLRFTLPDPPRLEFYVEGAVHAARAQLTRVLIEPDARRVCLTYVARQHELPRLFVPGVHAEIPLALVIDGDHVVRYETPPTLRARLEAGRR